MVCTMLGRNVKMKANTRKASYHRYLFRDNRVRGRLMLLQVAYCKRDNKMNNNPNSLQHVKDRPIYQPEQASDLHNKSDEVNVYRS